MLQSPSLSLIESEARRLVKRLTEQRFASRLQHLGNLCHSRWKEIRGPEPTTPLARRLWQVEPPLAHLFVELYDSADPRLGDALGSLTAAQGLALMVLAEIGRGDAFAARIAYDAMRHFEAGVAPAYVDALRRTVGWLSGPKPARRQGAHLRHASPLHQALAAIVAETGRPDSKAVLEVVGFLASGREAAIGDPQAARILSVLDGLGLGFVQVEHHRIRHTLHGAEKSVTPERLGEMLAEVRETGSP